MEINILHYVQILNNVVITQTFIFLRQHLVGRRRGRDRKVVGFTTTYAIGAYHY